MLENQVKAKSQKSFRLYFRKSSSNLVALSYPIAIGTRGVYDLKSINLNKGIKLTGTVSFVDRDSGVIPGEGAVVRANRWETISGPDGKFVLPSVPPGELNLRITAVGYQAIDMTINTNSQTIDDTLNSLAMFDGGGLSGALLIDNRSLMVQGSDPLTRIFSLKYTSDAAFVRVSENIQSLEIEQAGDIVIIGGTSNGTVVSETIQKAEWLPVASRVAYTFDTLGAKTLYYQFSDETYENFSEIYTFNFEMDIFARPGGIEINNGAESSASSDVNISFTVPEGAVAMKMAESLIDLETAGSLDPVESMSYTFSNGDGHVRGLFVQFIDSEGNLGSVYGDSINLSIFPENEVDFLSYSVLSDTSSSASATLQLNLVIDLEVITEASISEVAFSTVDNSDWVSAASAMTHVTPNKNKKFVYIKLKDKDGNVSAPYKLWINLDAMASE